MLPSAAVHPKKNPAFGGFCCARRGRCFSAKTFGYKGCRDGGKLLRATRELYGRDAVPHKNTGAFGIFAV